MESYRTSRPDFNCPTPGRPLQDSNPLDPSRGPRAYQYPLSRHRDNIATLRQELQTINSDISRVLHEIRQDPLLARHSHPWYREAPTANDTDSARSETNQQSATTDSDHIETAFRAAQAEASAVAFLRRYQVAVPERDWPVNIRQQIARLAPLRPEASMSTSRPLGFQPGHYRQPTMNTSTVPSDTEMQTGDDSYRPRAQGYTSVMNPDFYTPAAPMPPNVYHNGHTTTSGAGPYTAGPFVVSGGPAATAYGHMAQYNPYASQHHALPDYRPSPYPNVYAQPPAVTTAPGPFLNLEQGSFTNRRRSRSFEGQQETEPARRTLFGSHHPAGSRPHYGSGNPSFSHTGVQTTTAPTNPYQPQTTASPQDGTINASTRLRLSARNASRRNALSAPQSVPHQDIDMRDMPHGLDDDPNRPSPKENLTVKDVNLECKVCLSQIVDSVCLPCGHVCMCRWCVPQALPTIDHPSPRERRKATCPICREVVKQTVSTL